MKGVFKFNSWGSWQKLKPRTKSIMKQATCPLYFSLFGTKVHVITDKQSKRVKLGCRHIFKNQDIQFELRLVIVQNGQSYLINQMMIFCSM